jgi:DNA-binding GntR family transcriptional regulator
LSGQRKTTAKTRVRQPSVSLADQATVLLRDAIVELTLGPGSHLDERVLMRQVGISRTPAREALNRLASEGLVRVRANRGFFVAPLDIDDTARFFDAYYVVERSAAYFCRFTNTGFVADMVKMTHEHEQVVMARENLAITRINAQLHVRIAAATENPYLLEFATRIHTIARRLAYFVYVNESDDRSGHADQQRHIVREHGLIAGAIRRADRDALLNAMTSHAERFQARITRFFGSDRGAAFQVKAA